MSNNGERRDVDPNFSPITGNAPVWDTPGSSIFGETNSNQPTPTSFSALLGSVPASPYFISDMPSNTTRFVPFDSVPTGSADTLMSDEMQELLRQYFATTGSLSAPDTVYNASTDTVPALSPIALDTEFMEYEINTSSITTSREMRAHDPSPQIKRVTRLTRPRPYPEPPIVPQPSMPPTPTYDTELPPSPAGYPGLSHMFHPSGYETTTTTTTTTSSPSSSSSSSSSSRSSQPPVPVPVVFVEPNQETTMRARRGKTAPATKRKKADPETTMVDPALEQTIRYSPTKLMKFAFANDRLYYSMSENTSEDYGFIPPRALLAVLTTAEVVDSRFVEDLMKLINSYVAFACVFASEAEGTTKAARKLTRTRYVMPNCITFDVPYGSRVPDFVEIMFPGEWSVFRFSRSKFNRVAHPEGRLFPLINSSAEFEGRVGYYQNIAGLSGRPNRLIIHIDIFHILHGKFRKGWYNTMSYNHLSGMKPVHADVISLPREPSPDPTEIPERVYPLWTRVEYSKEGRRFVWATKSMIQNHVDPKEDPPASVLSALTLYYAAYQETSIRFHLQMISRNIMVYMQSLDGEGQVAIPRESFNIRNTLNYLMIDIIHRPLIDLAGVYELSKNGGPEHPAYTRDYNESMLRVEIPYNTLEARELVLSVNELDFICASYKPGWRTHFGKVSVSLPNSLTSVAISYYYIATLLRGGTDVMWAADAEAV